MSLFKGIARLINNTVEFEKFTDTSRTWVNHKGSLQKAIFQQIFTLA
jgi:hypothetical protein